MTESLAWEKPENDGLSTTLIQMEHASSSAVFNFEDLGPVKLVRLIYLQTVFQSSGDILSYWSRCLG